MRILLDTNVLLRLDDTAHSHHSEAVAAVDELDASGHQIVLVPQVIYEYWVVATRPADVNGLGLDTPRVDQNISEWLLVFTLLRDERRVFRFWRDIVNRFSVKGKNAHDARIAAAMQRHGLTHILTFNAGDFARFSGITAWTPSDVNAGTV